MGTNRLKKIKISPFNAATPPPSTSMAASRLNVGGLEPWERDAPQNILHAKVSPSCILVSHQEYQVYTSLVFCPERVVKDCVHEVLDDRCSAEVIRSE